MQCGRPIESQVRGQLGLKSYHCSFPGHWWAGRYFKENPLLEVGSSINSPAHGLKRAKANTTPQRLIVDQVLSMSTLCTPYIYTEGNCVILSWGKVLVRVWQSIYDVFSILVLVFAKINSYPTQVYGLCKFISLLLFKSNEPKTRI